jgi:hypothetical protein
VGDGVRDVVELQIEEDLATTGFDSLHHGRSLCGEKLQADLAESRWLSVIRQGVNESKGTVGIGNVEGDDDFVLGSGR